MGGWQRAALDEHFFKKRKIWLITCRSGETETMIAYILVNNKYRSSVKGVKVIPGEEIVRQHCFLSMDMILKKNVRMKVNPEEKKIETVEVERVQR